MVNEDILKEFLTNEYKRARFVRKELKKCPEGKLYQQMRDDKPYFIHSYFENGKTVHRGINANRALIVGLVRRNLLEQELRCFEKNLAVYENHFKKVCCFNLTKAVNDLQARYPAISKSIIDEALYAKSSFDWENEPFTQADFLPEGKTQITSRGLRVRSKSELLIAECLYRHNIPFRYEQLLEIENRHFYPDFTVVTAKGELVYWEHAGMMQDIRYRRMHSDKLRKYASIGIVPWRNLIVSYDDQDGNINLRIVNALIEGWLK